MQKKIVIKLGGSLLYDDKLNINAHIIKLVKTWYTDHRDEYSKIVLIVGGGKLSRLFGKKTAPFLETTDDEHGISMQVTQLNAQIIKESLDRKDTEICVPKSLGDLFDALYDENTQVIVSGGLKKGWSTDMDAAVAADCINVARVYKLSNVDYLYSSDPAVDKSSKPIKEISWKQYFKMFNILPGVSRHAPNQSVPIDVMCAQFAYVKGLSFFLSGGAVLLEDNIKSIDKQGGGRSNNKVVEDLADVFESGTFIHV